MTDTANKGPAGNYRGRSARWVCRLAFV